MSTSMLTYSLKSPRLCTNSLPQWPSLRSELMTQHVADITSGYSVRVWTIEEPDWGPIPIKIQWSIQNRWEMSCNIVPDSWLLKSWVCYDIHVIPDFKKKILLYRKKITLVTRTMPTRKLSCSSDAYNTYQVTNGTSVLCRKKRISAEWRISGMACGIAERLLPSAPNFPIVNFLDIPQGQALSEKYLNCQIKILNYLRWIASIVAWKWC